MTNVFVSIYWFLPVYCMDSFTAVLFCLQLSNTKVQCARGRAARIFAQEKGWLLGLDKLLFYSYSLFFCSEKRSFLNKAIVLSEVSATVLSVLAVSLQRTSSGGKSICFFQEQLTQTGACWQRAFLKVWEHIHPFSQQTSL